MSDPIKHECGIALIRLRKPLAYFQDKYGSSLYGFNKLFLLMEKQHNRGQDGVGIGCCKINPPMGEPYLFRDRDAEKDALPRIFGEQLGAFDQLVDQGVIDIKDPDSVKRHFNYGGEVLIGHLRYGTSGAVGNRACHPYVRRSNWPTRSLMVAGNFNMTNTAELNAKLIHRGQHPVFDTDTQTVLEEVGYHLDEVHTDIYRRLRGAGIAPEEIPKMISAELDVARIVKDSAEIWDGGYTIAGAVGNGDAFVMRDPSGIRPCFYFENEEMVGFASERVPLMTVFDLPAEEISELPRGHVAAIKNTGEMQIKQFAEPLEENRCSFERIYFSRGNDPDIYQERKRLGAALVPQLLEAIDHDLDHTVFTFIPNTAETAYQGLMGELRWAHRRRVRASLVESLKEGELDEARIDELILKNWPRGEKVANKDVKMRTFISQESGRNQLVSHVYDVTYGSLEEGDTLVAIDDSIVRGTTLQQSILKMLTRTDPKKIIITSTAPQIRYPDCYGIDMSVLGDFIAFRAAIALLKSTGRTPLIQDVYERCKEELKKPADKMENCVKEIYRPFSPEEISAKIAEMIRPADVAWKGDVEVIYQGIANLHASLPEHTGDWYFTGDYPTPGGYAVVNQAFIHYYEDRAGRPYDLLFEETA